MKFHTARPWGNTIVATESETLLAASVFVETCPIADPGMSAVRSDNPARAHQVRSQPNSVGMQSGDDGLPKQIDSGGYGSIDHEAMQLGSAYAEPLPGRKTGVHFRTGTDKPDAAEGIGLFWWNDDTQIGQRGNAVWHETFAARLVDGRNRAIGDYDLESALPGCDRRCESSRSSPDYENVSVPPMR
jgi:hypothetical protein